MKNLKGKITTLEFMQEVLKYYKKTASLQKTADELKISYSKVRKILITLGEYETNFSLEVEKKRKAGKSIQEIAAELNTSTNRVTAFLPYEKNLYIGPEQTTDAKKSNTKERDCNELLEKGCISKDELFVAESTLLIKHIPVCIHRDGAFVLDDVGGLSGFVNFLSEIHEGEDKEERNNLKVWAQSLGWSQRKISNKLIL